MAVDYVKIKCNLDVVNHFVTKKIMNQYKGNPKLPYNFYSVFAIVIVILKVNRYSVTETDLKLRFLKSLHQN